MKDDIGALLEPAAARRRIDVHVAEGQSIDGQGVDRSQIRAFLRLSPAERLREMQRFANAVLRIRHLNQGR